MNDDREMFVVDDAQPDANCFTLPDGSCVAPDPCMHTPELPKPKVAVIGGGAQAALAALLACQPPDRTMELERVRVNIPPVIVPPIEIQGADDVEYDIIMPGGGGTETVKAGQLHGTLDAVALAKRRLMQLKMVRVLLKRQKRRVKLAESRKNRVTKSRKQRDMQKASRKKNR